MLPLFQAAGVQKDLRHADVFTSELQFCVKLPVVSRGSLRPLLVTCCQLAAKLIKAG
jgi:hypothetical protein